MNELLGIVKELEWSGGMGCEGMGFMGSGPPMHLHQACPMCGGINPDDPQFAAFEGGQRCFNKSAEGHRPDCRLQGALA